MQRVGKVRDQLCQDPGTSESLHEAEDNTTKMVTDQPCGAKAVTGP